MLDSEEHSDATDTQRAAAKRQYKEDLSQAAIWEETWNDFEDTFPAPIGSTCAEVSEYKNEVTEYSKEVPRCLFDRELCGEKLWIEFTCTFQNETIKTMNESDKVSCVLGVCVCV